MNKGQGPAARRPGFPARLATPGQAPPVAAAGTAPAAPRQAASGLGLDSAAVRQAMVKRLQAQGPLHPDVARAMTDVERHRFVDSALVTQAYEDTSLPIGLGQTISKPSVVARMLGLLLEGRESPLGRVLEIGTGCGYQAAVLARVATEVYSIERLRGLHERARENLRPLRVPNLHLLLADGMLGYAAGAPYAAIIAAAGGDAIPPAWLEQLAVGGRLVAPAETEPGRQSLVMIERGPAGYTRRVLEAVQFVPLKSGTA